MRSAKLDLYIEQGSTFTRQVVMKESENGPAIDLTGSTFRGQIRKVAGFGQALAAFEFELSDQETNTGEFTFTLPPDESAGIRLEKQTSPERKTEFFTYDIEQVLPSGAVRRLLEGLVELSPEVTK
jgi:uncharacterized FAD-dependent dehydrogenase